jgi:polyphosphate kinase
MIDKAVIPARSTGKAGARRNGSRRFTKARDASSPDSPPLDDTQLYVNRELSLLEFQRRVLEEAQDESVPLLERVKFLSIVGSNLDEFFMVRVAGLTLQRRKRTV